MKSRRQDTKTHRDEEVTKLKDQVKKLKARDREKTKQIQRLRKELNKAGDLEVELVEVETQTETPTVEQTCPACRVGNSKKFQVGKWMLHVCSTCGYRKREEVKNDRSKV